MSNALHYKLRPLIGQVFDYLGEPWVLVEILADDDSVVLNRCSANAAKVVQANAYGMPTRRATETLTLPISDPADGGYSQDMLLLLEGRNTGSNTAS
jgi:hypothetical protein